MFQRKQPDNWGGKSREKLHLCKDMDTVLKYYSNKMRNMNAKSMSESQNVPI